MFTATTIWLQSLVTLPPAPIPPHRTTEDPIFSRMGFTFSKISGFPPTMNASVPSTALGSPPDTGASSIFDTLLLQFFADFRGRDGVDGRAVQNDAAGPERLCRAVFTEERFLYLR